MVKKILSVIFLISMISMPVSAYPEIPHGAEYPLIIKSEYNTKVDANKDSANKVVQFVTSETYTENRSGFVIPKGTIFNGKIRAVEKSKWGLRRASMIIDINEMRFPNGDIYTVSANTKQLKLKGSLLANTVKGLVGTPFALISGVAGSALMIVEIASIIGIVSVEPTAKATGALVDKFTKGVNYKKNAGNSVKLRINSIREYDIYRDVQGTIINQQKNTDNQDYADENSPEEQY